MDTKLVKIQFGKYSKYYFNYEWCLSMPIACIFAIKFEILIIIKVFIVLEFK